MIIVCWLMKYYADAAQCEYDVTNAVYRMHNELQQAKLQPRDVATVVNITRVCFILFILLSAVATAVLFSALSRSFFPLWTR